jgi:hypothetical protein
VLLVQVLYYSNTDNRERAEISKKGGVPEYVLGVLSTREREYTVYCTIYNTSSLLERESTVHVQVKVLVLVLDPNPFSL